MPGPSQATTASRPPEGEGLSRSRPLASFELPGRGSLRSLGDRISNDLEIVLLTGMLVALAGWFLSASRPEQERAFDVMPAVQASGAFAGSRTGAFDFVPAVAKDLRIPSQVGEPTDAPRHVETSAPAEPRAEALSSVDLHALVAEPPVAPFDHLGSVVLWGLPGDARLSAGARLSEPGAAFSDWAVAFGDLDDLIVYLPRNRTGAIRTTVGLHTRAGVKIMTLNLELREDAVPHDLPMAKARDERPVIKPANMRRPAGESAEKSKAQGAPRKASVVVKPAAGGASLAKPAVNSAVTKPAGGGAAVTWPPTAPLFFKPDPKDSSLSGLSPTLRDDPRFMTLRGLGMGSIAPPLGEGLSLTPPLP